MRLFVVVAVALLAGCPATQDPGSGPIDAGPDAALDAAIDAPEPPLCDHAVPTCTTTIRYRGPGAMVVLRGDFAADGWTAGVPMTRVGDAWEATIPANDQQVVVYKLVVDGTWQADPGNPRTSPDGFGARNSVVRVDCDHCPGRATLDWRDAILYFVMVDRFANGDATNDRPLGLEPPADYQGGDFVGLRQKIEEGYFDQLGVNTLWLTSPLDNADNRGAGSDGHDYSGYHGYWPRDLEQIESRIGTEAELKATIDAAHRHDLNVIVDYAMNHVHAESPTYATHPDWFWPNANGRGGNCVCGDGCNWDEPFDRKRCWFTSYLPDFDFRNDDARRWSVANAVAWAQKLGADGFRLDAVKHIEDAWVTDLRGRLDGEVEWDQVFYLVGETYTGERDLIKYYVNPQTMLDGQFDFPMRAVIIDNLLRRQGSMTDVGNFLVGNDTYYGPGAVMSTFIGNHDVPRVISFADDNPQYGSAWDSGRDRAWTNLPQVPSSARPFERLAVAYALLYTSPGVPLVYYGDEIGMAGGGDPDNRRFMQWSATTSNQDGLRAQLSRLAQVRKDHVALRRGARTIVGSSADVLVYEMRAPGDALTVALNRSDAAQPVPNLAPGSYDDLLTGERVTAPFSIPARRALVLIAR